MQYSRGCRYAMYLLRRLEYFGRGITFLRRIDEVLREIESQDRRFLFLSTTTLLRTGRLLRDLCEALIPMKVGWISQASLTSRETPS